MENSYKVLGISSSATDEEVSRAYRRLAKKYHPDLNPGDKIAEQKMREVNAAYEQIKTQKTGGASYERPDGSYGPQQHDQTGGGYSYRGNDPFGGFDFGGFGDIFGDIFGQAWEQQNNTHQESGPPNLQQVRLCIRSLRYQDALRLLNRIQERSAEWYYLSALASAGIGNRVTALNHAKEAVRLEPGNTEYKKLLDQFQQGSFSYRQAGQRQGFNMSSVGRSLMWIIIAQLACFFCCRGH